MKNFSKIFISLLNEELVDLSGYDPKQFLFAAEEHRLVVPLYKRLIKQDTVSPELLSGFKQACQQNQQLVLQQFQMQRELAQLFEQHSIPVIFLKGLLLSDFLYGDIAHRQIRDIDCLIPQEVVLLADKLLVEQGFQRSHDYPRSPKYQKLVFDNFKDLEYSHPVKNIILELHWRLESPNTFNPSFEKFWQEKRSVKLMQSTFYCLNPETEWLYLCAHGSRHGWKRLQWLYDLLNYQLVFHVPKQDSFVEKIRDYKILKHYQLALWMLTKNFPTKIRVNNQQTPHRYLRSFVEQQQAQLPVNQAQPDIKDQIQLLKYNFLLVSGLRNKWYQIACHARWKYLLKWTHQKIPVGFFWLCYPFFLIATSLKLLRNLQQWLKKKVCVS